jgi:mono/diheme cytochrome c family protein
VWVFKSAALMLIAGALQAPSGVQPGALPPEPGDPVRGRAIFESKGECLGCHRVRDRGSRFGPDLTDIGSRAGVLPARGTASPFAPIPPDIGPVARAQNELRQSLLEPAAEILPGNRTIRFVTHSGEAGTARVLNQDTFTFQLIDTNERMRTIPKADLREYTFIKSSPMPSYRDTLAPEELSDVIAYLMSLKGFNK